jgi:hypothetical protein
MATFVTSFADERAGWNAGTAADAQQGQAGSAGRQFL